MVIIGAPATHHDVLSQALRHSDRCMMQGTMVRLAQDVIFAFSMHAGRPRIAAADPIDPDRIRRAPEQARA